MFMDIVTAFAVLLRRIIFDHADSDEAWFHKLKLAGFSDDEIKIIYGCISNHEWLRVDSCNEFALAFTNEFYRNAWFSQESVPCVVTLGCMAGTP